MPHLWIISRLCGRIQASPERVKNRMAVKDITEKILLSYTDVFADVVNGLLFKGQQISMNIPA